MTSETFRKMLDVYVRLVTYDAALLDGDEIFEEDAKMLREVIDEACDEHFPNM